MRFRWSIVFAAALAVAAGTVSPAHAGTRAPCGPSGFAYAGLQSARNGHGITAALTALAQPSVESGHVAGWIGVGGPGQGAGGADEWLQAGLSSLPGTGNTLYYEVMRPGAGVSYVKVATDVPTGHRFQVAVLETSSTLGAWRVWVDGRPVSPPIMLSSGKRLTPMAMGESWGGGRQQACNLYSYRFARLSIAAARGGSWRPAGVSNVLQDPGFRVVRRASTTFDATATALSRGPVAAPSPAIVAPPPAPAAAPVESPVAATGESDAPPAEPVTAVESGPAPVESGPAPVERGLAP